MNTINSIIHEAFLNVTDDNFKINSDLSLKAVTLDAAWKKHGLGSSASSHILYGDEGYNVDVEGELRENFEHLLFIEGADADNMGIKGKWRTSFMSAGKNLLIARIDLSNLWTKFSAVLGAVKLEEVPADTVCTVEELGYHPTLTCKGEFKPTTEITVIIELDGYKDADLGDCRYKLKDKPVLVTWFPGRQLPQSNPTDCKVGDVMTAAEAKAHGWNTVSFKN